MVTPPTCSWRIPGLETLVNHVIPPTMIPVCSTSSTLTSWLKVALVLCQLQNRASYKSMYGKLMELNRCTLYCPWSFAPRQVRETPYQVTTKIISWSILWRAISSLIAKLWLTMIGLPTSNSFEKHKRRDHNQLWPLARKTNDVHVELGHPFKSITHTIAKALGI